MQTENKISILLASYTFLTFIHVSFETFQPCGDRDESLYRANDLTIFEETPRRFLRLRRSVLTDAGYGSRLQAASNVARSSDVSRNIFGKIGPGKRSKHFSDQEDRLNELQTLQRILSDCSYGSKLEKDESISYSNDRDGRIDLLRPGKRSVEITDFDMLFGDNTTKNKRLSTDYGYGSRLQAGRNIAKIRDHSKLFGIMGPGKRSFFKQDIAKRIAIDLGYGSRLQAAENVAKSSNEDFFGAYGPGKRNGYLK